MAVPTARVESCRDCEGPVFSSIGARLKGGLSRAFGALKKHVGPRIFCWLSARRRSNVELSGLKGSVQKKGDKQQ